MKEWLLRLCERITRRDCRRAREAVGATLADVRHAHAVRLEAHRRLDHTLAKLR